MTNKEDNESDSSESSRHMSNARVLSNRVRFLSYACGE
jgi:hypothetical protein